MEAVNDLVDKAMEQVRSEDLRFTRPFFYVAASVLAWYVFWEMADRRNDRHTQTMAWTFVFVAMCASHYL